MGESLPNYHTLPDQKRSGILVSAPKFFDSWLNSSNIAEKEV